MTLNSHDQLIRGLGAELRPVRRLPAPLFRALAWLAVLVALAIVLAAFANLDAVWQRISAAPDLWLAVIGSTLTAVLAAISSSVCRMRRAHGRCCRCPLPCYGWGRAASAACGSGSRRKVTLRR